MDLCQHFKVPNAVPFIALELFEVVCKQSILQEKGLQFGQTRVTTMHVSSNPETLSGATAAICPREIRFAAA